MKKLLIFILLPFMFLTGCASSGATPVDKREQVTLTAENYSKYIAVYTISDTYSISYTYSLYRYKLEGSCLCKFNDCKITYCFADKDGNCNKTTYTIDLTISGCGESKEVSVSYYGGGKSSEKYFFHVVSASGTVEILY